MLRQLGEAHLTEENGVEESWLETFSKLGEKVVDESAMNRRSPPRFSPCCEKRKDLLNVAGRAKFIGHLLRELRLAEHVAAVKESGSLRWKLFCPALAAKQTQKCFNSRDHILKLQMK